MAPADPMVPRIAHIQRRRREAPHVWTLDLAMQEAAQIDFAPGQFNMLTVFGVGEIPISISGDPSDMFHLAHTVRDVGAVSGALTRLELGAVVGVRGPFGIGWPIAEAKGRDVVMIAGGIGLAPLRPALYRLLAERRHYGKVTLLYGTRNSKNIIYHTELERWRRRSDTKIEMTVDQALSDWHGHVGVVTALIPRVNVDPLSTIAFICGPEIMMRFTVAALLDAGVEEQSIYLSMERNMKCAIGQCGHCQFGPVFVCRDGPVFRYDRVRSFLTAKEL